MKLIVLTQNMSFAHPSGRPDWKAGEWSSAARAMRRTMGEGERREEEKKRVMGKIYYFPKTNLNEKEERRARVLDRLGVTRLKSQHCGSGSY